MLASPSGDLYVAGANTTTHFAKNYTTKDSVLGGAKMNAIDLDITAAELFADPDNGDPVSYTHLDVYKRQVLK